MEKSVLCSIIHQTYNLNTLPFSSYKIYTKDGKDFFTTEDCNKSQCNHFIYSDTGLKTIGRCALNVFKEYYIEFQKYLLISEIKQLQFQDLIKIIQTLVYKDYSICSCENKDKLLIILRSPSLRNLATHNSFILSPDYNNNLVHVISMNLK